MTEKENISEYFKELQKVEEIEELALGEKVKLTNKKLNDTTEILSLLMLKQLPDLLIKINENHKQIQETLDNIQLSLNKINEKVIEPPINIKPPITW